MSSNSDDDDVGSGTNSTCNSNSDLNDDWQHITKPGPNDVLCGRGGGTNNHPGNVKFRHMINEHKLRYLAASKVEKPKVAREVVKLWRGLEPSGRILARKDDSKRGPGSVKAEGNVWHDVGDKKAREKASQCLRERTPDVLPYVREMQRRQDLLTGQGLRLVEQQMRMRSEQGVNGSVNVNVNVNGNVNNVNVNNGSHIGSGQHQHQHQMNGQSVSAQMNGTHAGMNNNNAYQTQPVSAHAGAPMSEPDINNAFSVEHFFTHGFQNNPASYQAANPDDPLSLQQMSRDPQRWDQAAGFNINTNGGGGGGQHQHQMLPPQQVFSSTTVDHLEPTQAFPVESPRPDGVGSSAALPPMTGTPAGGNMLPFGAFDDEQLTLEEYMESMKDIKAYHIDPAGQAPQTNELLGMQTNSWVKSFHSIDNPSRMSTADSAALHDSNGSIDHIAHTKPPKRKSSKRSQGLAQALQRTSNAGGNSHLPRQQSTRTALSATTQKSAMSAISTKSGQSAMSGISMFSDMTEKSRDSKMDSARGMASSLSMMSDFTELTDLSETLGNIDLSSTAAGASTTS
mmetsp:Transcript_29907/g.49347  ORF Transcript_29907/g.49347 Transcript_29907/m.49347 type:complete len:567 (-) Transcript_29907:362-2062(-)|eukprot:CAMPEP_0119015222 /NCGR_PEP_ID=MMETSP1176-20130426/10628_1 /TAXON_ID=265551 /ORGANISM="Synedropsis recta cf, Strain CCMP1620" /LENGTH=566 /DNA_ID=CAMNT_0006968499 /DNA_START=230 /DNA_END=1930 /DNA_ORIENTATION=-